MPPSYSEKPAPDTCLFIVDEEGLVFSESQQAIYKLNPPATYIWCLLEEKTTLDTVINKYRETFLLEAELATSQVTAVIKQWEKSGLLEGTERNHPETLTQQVSMLEDYKSVDNMPVYIQTEAHQIYNYFLLNSYVRVRYSSAEQVQWVHPVLEHLNVDKTLHIDNTIDIKAHGNQLYIYRDQEAIAAIADIRALAPRIKALVLQAAINKHRYFIYVHGAVVARDDYCLLLPGTSGSGKSTLTAALIQSKFQYMSDEIALLEESSFQIKPTPISLGIKSTGWDVLSDYYPEINQLAIHHREDGKYVRYLTPPELASQAALQQSLPVRAIIFPHYAPESKTSLSPCKAASALKYIMDDCLALPNALTKKNIGELVQWLGKTPCYTLTMSSLEDAVKVIDEMDLR